LALAAVTPVPFLRKRKYPAIPPCRQAAMFLTQLKNIYEGTTKQKGLCRWI
jgi:hypothetical protein